MKTVETLTVRRARWWISVFRGRTRYKFGAVGPSCGIGMRRRHRFSFARITASFGFGFRDANRQVAGLFRGPCRFPWAAVSPIRSLRSSVSRASTAVTTQRRSCCSAFLLFRSATARNALFRTKTRWTDIGMLRVETRFVDWWEILLLGFLGSSKNLMPLMIRNSDGSSRTKTPSDSLKLTDSAKLQLTV